MTCRNARRKWFTRPSTSKARARISTEKFLPSSLSASPASSYSLWPSTRTPPSCSPFWWLNSWPGVTSVSEPLPKTTSSPNTNAGPLYDKFVEVIITFYHRYLIEVDCSLSPFKPAKLKDKKIHYECCWCCISLYAFFITRLPPEFLPVLGPLTRWCSNAM